MQRWIYFELKQLHLWRFWFF